LIKFENINKRTKDGLWTYHKLLKRVETIVHRINTTNDSDEDIVNFIERCFIPNGILEIYDKCGYQGWHRIIQQMAEVEVHERSRHNG
jgi:hypothetical protein